MPVKGITENNLTRSMPHAIKELRGHEEDAMASANPGPCEPKVARFSGRNQRSKPNQTHWTKLVYYQQDRLKMTQANPLGISPLLSVVYSHFGPVFREIWMRRGKLKDCDNVLVVSKWLSPVRKGSDGQGEVTGKGAGLQGHHGTRSKATDSPIE